MQIKIRLLAFALLCLFLRFPVPVQAEVIHAFNTDVHLQPDTSLDVTENIVYDFEGAQKHGIFRHIPVTYNRYNNNYTLYLDVQSVTDESGQPYKYQTSRQGDDLEIKIGDPDQTITGAHTYRLHYLVRRAVNFFQNAPEVYWNATGNEWPATIQQATARFYPPPGVSMSAVKHTCFAGPSGTTAPGTESVEAQSITYSASNLAPGSGLTFVAGLPAGSVTPPSAMQNLIWLLKDWWPILLFPIISIFVVVPRYLKSGRDEDRGQAVAVEWNPPTNLTPAEVGTLIDERCDMADIVSTLVDLAARGFLTIQEQQSEKFLFLSSKDYLFTKKPGANTTVLLPHEQEFYIGLFSTSESVTLSSLKNKFYTHLPKIKDGIYQSLTDKKMFTSNPETTRGAYGGIGWGMLFGGIILTVLTASTHFWIYGLGLALAGLVPLLFAKAMPAKTALGSQTLRQCLGFQRFVRMAEKDRIAVLAKDDPTIFGRLLPYAMVLGVADHWADAFKDLMNQPPDWYTPYGYGPGYMFSPHAFVSDLGGGMNTMGSTFSSAPSSSGGSGGSGFSGGGGGGGFGGGGGGSW